MSSFSDTQADRYESLVSFNERGQLNWFTEDLPKKYETWVDLTIDGQGMRVRQAVFVRDRHGTVVRDGGGSPTLRETTIYDAAGWPPRPDDATGLPPAEELPWQRPDSIPVLCHQEHLSPVGVCRICSVLVVSRKEGVAKGQFVPACSTTVGSLVEKRTTDSTVVKEVHTIDSRTKLRLAGQAEEIEAGLQVRAHVGVLLDLLLAYHRHPAQEQEGRYRNELEEIVRRHGLTPESGRFAKRPHRSELVDQSGGVIRVDHNNCVLCNRCVRSCSHVRPFHIIGQRGKGYQARIGFDLGKGIGDSACVQCGECMVSCPTGALTFLKPVCQTEEPGTVLTVEVAAHPLFQGLPYNFLKWNEGAAVRRTYRAGHPLCNEGEYGSSAFVLLCGQYQIRVKLPESEGFFLRRRRPPSGDPWDCYGSLIATRTPADVLLGEMSILSGDRRSATIVAATDDCEVWEIRGTLLRTLLHNDLARQFLKDLCTRRALENLIHDCREPASTSSGRRRNRWLFKNLTERQSRECVEFLQGKMTLIEATTGQVILQQGAEALWSAGPTPDDGFFIIRAGFVKVSGDREREEPTHDLLVPGDHFGEISLLSEYEEVAAALPPGTPRGVCAATCTAMGRVELVRIPGQAFQDLLKAHPDVAKALIAVARLRLEKNACLLERLKSILRIRRERARSRDNLQQGLDQRQDLRVKYLQQGLYQGQSLLVIDGDRCTGCDECIRACVESHRDETNVEVTRMRREGPLLDRFLIVTSCRSCHQAYCLDECPVDAIHRRGRSPEIVIDSHCIGCGLCALNCPYHNIVMYERRADSSTPDRKAARLATTCDLCGGENGPGPRCVSACPHNAALRCTGQELLTWVGIGS